MSTRRSTRRTAASAEPTPPALEQISQNIATAVEPPRKKGRKSKAAAPAAAHVESQSVTQSQSQSQPTTKASATSRAPSASTTTTTTAATVVSKRTTRAAKAAGEGSPLRVYQPPERKRKRTRGQTASATPEPAQPEPTQDDDNDDDQGIFFSKNFDAQLLNLPTTSPARPMFVNSSESAIALLTKIENAAKEPLQCDKPVTEDGSALSDADVDMERAPPPPSTKRTYEESATPARPITVPSSFFTRSFSAIKSIKSLFSTPTPKAPLPTQTAPAADSLTEALSAPPTPVGERTKIPAKKKKKTDRMMRTLLKGIDAADERKAEEWARQIMPSLKNDNAFREKRKRLETPVLLKDLNNFPAAKPWETGFGDPLAELDDDDVVPVWAVYLDIVAEEEERAAKKHKTTHGAILGFEDVPTINEQYAASQSALSSHRLFDSHGQTASDLDFHPRRSIVPSPMFDTSRSHHQGGNVFKELHGHNTAAQIRTNDREVLQSATKTFGQNDNPSTGSFSVPDDSDSDDSTMISETNGNTHTPATPVWTQAPPPAPVPAHAPLPGGAADDAASTTATEKPVDEVERQRQRLMKFTPAKPSRLREATYPSPSLFSDAGNESIIMATPAQTAAVMDPIFSTIPGAEMIELNDEEQAHFDAIVSTDAYKQQLATPWAPAIITYDSDEEDLSPL
ncbi:hypothetical protein T440DRAFT_470283 [Plenodomus tracheiphilus IPT5]|uniref:Uncharacterized protein n=1 Tax=Plenodomus tracheiphilus IPT5 TaxID=1408161 RepID=A0A6A7B1X4_9PLEO|nr:hypothetical protein T440DRAFT_470283 [Plenodomus tracheiphilus IPT5]